MSGIVFSLYNINEKLRATLDDCVDHETGEVNPVWDTIVENIAMRRDDLALDCAAYHKEQKAMAAGIALEIKRLEAKAIACEKRADAAKRAISNTVKPGEKIASTIASVSWRESSGVEISDESAVPDSFFHITRKVSKIEIGAAIKRGETVPGAEIVKRNNLVIK